MRARRLQRRGRVANGANGISDIEGNAARVRASDYGQRVGVNQELETINIMTERSGSGLPQIADDREVAANRDRA